MRKSTSMSIILSPAAAKLSARLTAMVVFPSLGKPLVTRKLFERVSAPDSCMDTREERMASEKGARGCRRKVFSTPSSPDFSWGIMPNMGIWNRSDISSGFVMVSAKYSDRKAKPMPQRRPTTMPSNKFSLTLGLTAKIGKEARSTIWILLADTPAMDSISLERSSRL